MRPLSPTSRQLCSILQRAHGDTLWVEGFQLIPVANEELELQLGVLGSSLAWLGVKAWRYLASVTGLTGNRTRKSHFCRA